MVAQVRLKIKYKQAQGWISLTINVEIPQVVKGLCHSTFVNSHPLHQQGIERASVYLMTMNHLKRTITPPSLGNNVFDLEKRNTFLYLLLLSRSVMSDSLRSG